MNKHKRKLTKELELTFDTCLHWIGKVFKSNKRKIKKTTLKRLAVVKQCLPYMTNAFISNETSQICFCLEHIANCFACKTKQEFSDKLIDFSCAELDGMLSIFIGRLASLSNSCIVLGGKASSVLFMDSDAVSSMQASKLHNAVDKLGDIFTAKLFDANIDFEDLLELLTGATAETLGLWDNTEGGNSDSLVGSILVCSAYHIICNIVAFNIRKDGCDVGSILYDELGLSKENKAELVAKLKSVASTPIATSELNSILKLMVLNFPSNASTGSILAEMDNEDSIGQLIQGLAAKINDAFDVQTSDVFGVAYCEWNTLATSFVGKLISYFDNGGELNDPYDSELEDILQDVGSIKDVVDDKISKVVDKLGPKLTIDSYYDKYVTQPDSQSVYDYVVSAVNHGDLRDAHKELYKSSRLTLLAVHDKSEVDDDELGDEGGNVGSRRRFNR